MKEVWRIVALVAAFYLLSRYESQKGLQWGDILGDMIVAYLFTAVLRGL